MGVDVGCSQFVNGGWSWDKGVRKPSASPVQDFFYECFLSPSVVWQCGRDEKTRRAP